MTIEEIQTVKECEGGFMINGIAFVPNQEDIQDYQVIKEWAERVDSFIEPRYSNEELEEIRINAINQKASDIILSKYPIGKQSSAQLGIYGDEYLATMKSFIKQVIDISNEAIDNKTPADEIDWIELDNG